MMESSKNAKKSVLDKMNIIIVLLGIVGIFSLNGLRIAMIIYLAINYSVNASKVFHSTIYDLIFWIYILVVIGILKRFGGTST